MLPTHTQELLLKAALLPGETAQQAWQSWRAQVNFERDVDPGSFRLLPLVYRNLHALEVNDPLMGKLKGIYHREWLKNQMLFHTIAEVLRLFQAAGIETLILKGAALAQLYYKNYGLRPMDNFDVLVPTAKQRAAIDLLTQAAWKSGFVSPERLTAAVLETRHAWNFTDAAQRGLDLHWHVLIDCRYPQADDDFWVGSVPLQVGDISTRALNPTDQLLHVCVHGLAWNPIAPVRWIADALTILKTVRSEIDWARLVAQAQHRRVTLPLHKALAYLHDSFDAAIPSLALDEMSKVRISNIERKLFRAATTKPSLLGGLPHLWYRHVFDLEASGQTNWLQKVVRFPRYLRGAMAINRWRLLIWVISRPFVRIGKTVRGLK